MSTFGPPLSIHDLAMLMKQHGIVCRTRDEELFLESRLSAVGYYRLEEYSWPFRKLDPQDNDRRLSEFKQKMSFGPVWATYLFDRRLRVLLIDAIERFEIAMRNMVTQILVDAAGDAYPLKQSSTLIPGFQAEDPKNKNKTRGDKWLAQVQKSYNDNETPRIMHCKDFHGVAQIEKLPFWIISELLTFGELKTLYDSLDKTLKDTLARRFGVARAFLSSSFALIIQVRNKCAHHARVWNIDWKKTDSRNQQKEVPFFRYNLTDAPWLAYYDESSLSWKLPVHHTTRTSFPAITTAFVFVLCGFWLDKISPASHWKQRVEHVIQPSGVMHPRAKDSGFPLHWEKHPLWKI